MTQTETTYTAMRTDKNEVYSTTDRIEYLKHSNYGNIRPMSEHELKLFRRGLAIPQRVWAEGNLMDIKSSEEAQRKQEQLNEAVRQKQRSFKEEFNQTVGDVAPISLPAKSHRAVITITRQIEKKYEEIKDLQNVLDVILKNNKNLE